MLTCSTSATPLRKYGVALILYTGPAACPSLSWDVLSYVDDQGTAVAGAEKLLEDLEKGIGRVMGHLMEIGESNVVHQVVPDLVYEFEEEISGANIVIRESEKWEASLNGIEEEEEEEEEEGEEAEVRVRVGGSVTSKQAHIFTAGIIHPNSYTLSHELSNRHMFYDPPKERKSHWAHYLQNIEGKIALYVFSHLPVPIGLIKP